MDFQDLTRPAVLGIASPLEDQHVITNDETVT